MQKTQSGAKIFCHQPPLQAKHSGKALLGDREGCIKNKSSCDFHLSKELEAVRTSPSQMKGHNLLVKQTGGEFYGVFHFLWKLELGARSEVTLELSAFNL